MIAAIPYFTLGVYNLELFGLTIPIDAWATLVCVGFVVGLELSRARGIKLGLDVRDVVDGAVFIVLSGFFVGHVFTVLAYHPERLQTDGIWSILKVWEGFSSFGGFLGAVLGGMLFWMVIRKRPFWRHVDVIVYGFPFGWFFGRVGCGVVHDHIGALTTFPLAMQFPEGHFAAGLRHELGLYEAAYMVLVCALVLWLGRTDRVPGFFAGLFAVLYAPVRFGLDFLRNQDLEYQDARYLGLTPAQFGALVMLGLGVAVLVTRKRDGFTPHPLDGSRPDAPAEAAGG